MTTAERPFLGDPADKPTEEAMLLLRVIQERLAHSMVIEAELPHVIMATDDATGEVYLIGPFPNGFAAVVEAERKTQAERDNVSQVRYSVRALQHPWST